jgi:hypothetical protein
MSNLILEGHTIMNPGFHCWVTRFFALERDDNREYR